MPKNTSTAGRNAGKSDGGRIAWIRPTDCDARGAFNKRAELSETDWRTYQTAFVAEFKKVVSL